MSAPNPTDSRIPPPTLRHFGIEKNTVAATNLATGTSQIAVPLTYVHPPTQTISDTPVPTPKPAINFNKRRASEVGGVGGVLA